MDTQQIHHLQQLSTQQQQQFKIQKVDRLQSPLSHSEDKINREDFLNLKLELKELTAQVGGVHNLVRNLLTPLYKLVQIHQQQREQQQTQKNNGENLGVNQAQVDLLVEKLMLGIQERLGSDLEAAQSKLLGSVMQVVSSYDSKYDELSKEIGEKSKSPKAQYQEVLEKVKQVKQAATSSHQFTEYKLEQLRLDFNLKMQKLEIKMKLGGLKRKS